MRPGAILDERGFKALLRAAAQRPAWWAPRDRFLIYLLGKTGLRITEALSLVRPDFWVTGRGLPSSASGIGAGPWFLRVKTLKRRAIRTDEVLLDENAARVAWTYLSRTYPALLAKAGLESAHPFSGPVFPALLSQGAAQHPVAMTRYRAWQAIRLYARLAGLPPGVTAHSLRHYRATQLLRATGDLEFTRQQLRHADIRNTQRYQHADPQRAAGYLARIADTEGL